MTQQQTPPWYQPGDIAASVRRTTVRDGVSTTDIVDVLATHEIDAPRNRIRALVESAHDQLTSNSNQEHTPDPDLENAEPRPPTPRVVAADDIAYLGPRDFGRVLGAVLSQYEGGFQLPEEVDGSAVNLFWYRQRITVAVRAVPRTPGTTVDTSVVKAVAEGSTNPTTGRPSSTVGIVSNAKFTSDAHTVAAENDIQLFENPTLEQWFHDVRLTHDVFGDLLEHQNLTDEEYDTILDDLPPLPPQLQDQDPLTRHPTSIEQDPSSLDRTQIGSDDPDSDTDTGESTPPDSPSEELLAEAPEAAGEKGVLYANPDEDGDAGAFDQFAAEFMEDSE